MSKDRYVEMLGGKSALNEDAAFDMAKDKLVDRELINDIKGMLKGASKKTILNLFQEIKKMT